MPDSNVLGALDLFVLGGVAGLLLYYFLFRRTKKEEPSFKKLTVGYHTFVSFAELAHVNAHFVLIYK